MWTTRALEPLLAALGVRRRDLALLVALGMAYMMANAGANLGFLALTGRFLGRVGAGRMPWVYVALNLFTMALFMGIAFGSGARRNRDLPLILCATGYVALLVVLVALPQLARNEVAIFLGYLLAWIYTIVVEQEFWVWLSGLLPVRPAKRLTSGVGACGTVGRLLGAFLVTDPLGFDSISGHLLAAAVLTLLVFPFMRFARHLAGQHAEVLGALEDPASAEVAAQPRPGVRQTLEYVWGSRLLRRAALLSFALGITLGTADYPLAVTAQQHFADEEALAAFYGIFGAVTNLLSVLVQFLGSSFLVQRLPLRVTLALLPASMLGVGVLGCLHPGFHLAAAARFTQRMGVRVVQTPACLTLFNPIPGRFAVGARALAYSVAISAGFTVAGLGMLLFQGGEAPLVWVFGALAASGLLGMVAAQGADGAYLGALLAATRAQGDERDRETALAAAIAYAGGSSEAPVLLAAGDPQLRASVEEAVARVGQGDFHETLVDSLAQAGPEVAVAAQERISRSHLPGPVSRGLTRICLEHGDQELLRRALRAVGSLEDPGSAPLLVELAASGEVPPTALPRVYEALLRCAVEREHLLRGVTGLRRALVSSDPAVRVATVRVLGRMGMDVFGGALLGALDDPDLGVATEAARALEWARLPGTREALEARLERTAPGELRDELLRTVESLRNPHLDQVALRLGSFRSRERKRLAQTMNVLGTGRTLPLVAKALEIEWAPARAAVVRTLTEVEEEDFHAVVERALDGAEGRGSGPCLGPLLEFVGQTLPSEEHAVYGLLTRLYRRSQAQTVAAFCEEMLGDLDPVRDPLVELRQRLEVVAFLAGLARGDAQGFREAVAVAAAGSARKASAAIELVETGVPSPSLRARMGRGLEQLRARTLAGEATA